MSRLDSMSVFTAAFVLVRMASGAAVLYAPSNPDDANFRSEVAGFTGEACNYYDARNGTPTLDALVAYDLVFTWSNYGVSGCVRDADLDCDGHVDLSDLAAFLSAYRTGCE